MEKTMTTTETQEQPRYGIPVRPPEQEIRDAAGRFAAAMDSVESLTARRAFRALQQDREIVGLAMLGAEAAPRLPDATVYVEHGRLMIESARIYGRAQIRPRIDDWKVSVKVDGFEWWQRKPTFAETFAWLLHVIDGGHPDGR